MHIFSTLFTQNFSHLPLNSRYQIENDVIYLAYNLPLGRRIVIAICMIS
jgi:hypothetical protein